MAIQYFKELKAKQRHAFYILEAGDFSVSSPQLSRVEMT